MERLKGEVAIVTGGANRIGRTFCPGLADEGASVMVADIEQQAGEHLASEMREMGPFGIRVNTLCPGLVKTDRATLPEERYQRTAQERALRTALLHDDLVGPLVFLCSDDASTAAGHALVVDRGQIFQ